MAESPTDNLKEMSYDLRQYYAKIVGEHLEDAAEARKKNKYNFWFDCLVDIYVVIHHKIKDPSNAEQEYNKKVDAIAKISQANKEVWSGNNKDSKSTATVKNCLIDLEMWLYTKMEDANMFGRKMSDDEDEL